MTKTVSLAIAVISVSNLSAAVRLYPSTNTEYYATIPANSNKICGIGMGPNADYTFFRGEDVDWIAEAIRERLNGSGGTSIWHPKLRFTGMIPVERDMIDGGLVSSDVISNVFLLCEDARQTGFVRENCTPIIHDAQGRMSGEALPCTVSNGTFMVNGTNAETYVLRSLIPRENLFKSEELPPSVTLYGYVDLATITNCYHVLKDDDRRFTTIAKTTDRYDYYKDKTNRTYTVYDDDTVSKDCLVSNIVARNEFGTYVTDYVITTNRTFHYHYTTTNAYIRAYSSRSITYETPASLERISRNTDVGATVHALDPYEHYNNYSTYFPTDGGHFFFNYSLVTGRENEDGDYVHNTNVTVHAYLVTYWTYSDITKVQGYDGVNCRSITNSVRSATYENFITVTDIGTAERVTSDYSQEMWKSTGIDSAIVIGNAVVYLDRKGYDIEDVPINNPAIFPKENYPTICSSTSGYVRSYMQTTRTKNLEPQRTLMLIIVKPVWRTRFTD